MGYCKRRNNQYVVFWPYFDPGGGGEGGRCNTATRFYPGNASWLEARALLLGSLFKQRESQGVERGGGGRGFTAPPTRFPQPPSSAALPPRAPAQAAPSPRLPAAEGGRGGGFVTRPWRGPGIGSAAAGPAPRRRPPPPRAQGEPPPLEPSGESSAREEARLTGARRRLQETFPLSASLRFVWAETRQRRLRRAPSVCLGNWANALWKSRQPVVSLGFSLLALADSLRGV